jgi:hypothetical protein
MVQNAASFLRQTLGEQQGNRVIEGFSPKAREVIATAKAADWSPVTVFSEITQALAVAGGNDEKAQQLLIACGAHMAREATNTFFRLVLKMLTVPLFVKRLPEFWKRDCSGGRLVLKEVTDQVVTFETYDMDGFKHAVCTAAGFVSFAVGTMGKTVEKITIRNWSVDKPSADGATFELTWS